MPAGIAAGHPATAEVGLRVLAAGGSAADAAVAGVLASCVGETLLTGIAGGGFATYYDATARTVTCLDFFVAAPGLDGDRQPAPMVPIEVDFGGVPLPYSVGAPSAAVPGVPAGCGEIHARWGRLPWHQVVAPAVELARRGAALPSAQADTLPALAPAMLPGEGAAVYAPAGRLLRGGDRLYHPGLDRAMELLAEQGPDVFYTGKLGELMVDTLRAGGAAFGPVDLASYRVLEVPALRADFAGVNVYGRKDLNCAIETIAALGDLSRLSRGERAVAVAAVLRDQNRPRLGDTTNISVVDPEGNACVVTTTLGLGSTVWLPGYGVHLNSMLGEGELYVGELAPGTRMSSMMCPMVVTGSAATPTLGQGPAVPSEHAATDGLDAAVEPDTPALPADSLVSVRINTSGPAAGETVTIAELSDVIGDPPDELGGRRPAPLPEPVGDLVLAAGAAGASRIRTALVHTLIGVLIDGLEPEEAIARPRYHVTDRIAHLEPGVPAEEVAALRGAGYEIRRWDRLNHYFGGASAVGRTGAGGDPRRGGAGLHLEPPAP